MSNITQQIKSYKTVYPQIYAYILPELPENEGSQKIGYTERENVETRIKEQAVNAARRLKYKTLWSAPAFFEDGEDFKDKIFHKFLIKKGIEHKIDLGLEWFYFNGEPFKSKDLFDLFRKEKFKAIQNKSNKKEYTLRFEQEKAVKKALEYFEKNEKGEFLWNAKPRFGKTLASYDLAKRLKASKVLIVTNRPAIANSWFDDYEMFIDGYAFISETSSLNNRPTISRAQYTEIIKTGFIGQFTFLSLQDLKGSKYFSANGIEKLRWIADLDWDLLIIDEAHEGIDTAKTNAAFDVIKRKNTLHLSGTPFKQLANEKFSKEAIFNWTYLDEQKMKHLELEEGETGEHTDMPDLRLFTYRISEMTTKQVNEGLEIDSENVDFAFDLNEFFKAKDKKFIRENEVIEFLKNLSTNKKYPFSTPELREELKHTFWYVGNRVDSVKALEQLLKKDAVFKDYKIVVAAGNGQTFEEEENDFKANESSFEKVKKAIKENDKTITLSCGQLTTGVTVKEWTAVLMLTDIKTPSVYMQAAFRAQNPYKELRNGEWFAKKSAYLFDFAPTRVLEIYDEFANKLNPKTELTEKEKEQNIKELLNFFPVISEDVNGEMIELDAQKVLTFPNVLAGTEIVKARFMTNLLFNDSLKGVFNFPKEAEEILNKLSEEKNKRVQKTTNTLNLDDARQANDNKSAKINQNTEIILGNKIFKTNIERVVDNLLEQNQEQISSDALFENFSEVAERPIAKYKEIYKPTQVETTASNKVIQEKVKAYATAFNNGEMDSDALKKKLIETIEFDFVANSVTQKEEEIVAKVQKTKEEEIKDRLRSFTRTIPMFIMANASKDEITIDNFDNEIVDKDFLELTSITKAEFHKLRDGFDYEEEGERKTFTGVFNKYRFNASIAEFKEKKDQLSNYFTAEDDIFELIPPQKTNQIFTPKKVVQMMINNLEAHDPSLFTRTDSTFIDLYMKSGMYITEIVKKLFNNTRKQYKSDNDCLKHILENQVYGLSPTPILQGITQSYIFGFDVDQNILRKNFVQHDITPAAQQDTAKEKLQELFNLNKDMKFDAVVGNPPYDDKDGSGGQGSSARPIYNYFVNSAKDINPKIINLIMPTRWYAGGKGLDDFRKQMLNDKNIVEIQDFLNPSLIFPSTNIRGGVCFVLWDNDYNNEKDLVNVVTYGNSLLDKKELKRKLKFDGADIFIRHIESLEIVKKIKSQVGYTPFEKYVSSRKPFGLDSKFDRSPDYHKTKSGLKEPVICFAKRQEVGYVDNVKFNFDKSRLNSYKVFTSFANNIGTELNDDNLNTFIGQPSTICTETYIILGDGLDVNEDSAQNIIKYFKTKFSRFLHGIAKSNQNGTSKTYKFVPLQDFTHNSDIDWSQSIPEIDQQLYKKYGLSEEEISFIESMIRPMG